MTGLTRDMQESPIDDEFEGRVRDLHIQHVQPVLLEIEELSHDLGLKAGVERAMQSGAGRRVVGAAMGFAAADLASIPPMLLSTFAITVDIAAQVMRDRKEIKRSQRENLVLLPL